MDSTNKLNLFLKSIRIHQWVKNLLIFLPLILAHQVQNTSLLLNCFIAFFAFCFSASSMYLFNDIIDLKADRQHPTKKFRPLAARELSLKVVVVFIILFLFVGVGLSLLVSKNFIFYLLVYIIVSALYSLVLKKYYIIDVLTLASLYTIRIFAGSVAVSVVISNWFLALSMFLFLALAILKRYAELHTMKIKNLSVKGRGYVTSDMNQMAIFGTACGYLTILVFALYIDSQKVLELYSKPEVLWLICPLLFYWVSRIWLLAQRGQMHEDPIIFTIKDKASYIVAVITILIMIYAK